MLILEIALGIAFGIALIPFAIRCLDRIWRIFAFCRLFCRQAFSQRPTRNPVFWGGFLLLSWLLDYLHRSGALQQP